DLRASIAGMTRDLKQAADVAHGHRRGACGFDPVELAAAEAVGHVGLGEVVGSRRATAKLALFEWNKLDARDHRQELTGLATNLLAVAEVAGVVIREFEGNFNRRTDRAEGDE